MSRTSRFEQLKALIEHKNTPEHERDAAQRALDRLKAQHHQTEQSNYDDQGRWMGSYSSRAYGAKATTKYHPATEIAKWMRADIKIARQVANAPAEDEHGVAIPSGFAGIPREIKFTVSTDSGSMHSSIHINIRNIPPAWGWYTAPHRDIYDHGWEMRDQPTPELLRLVRELEEIHWSYNWDGSDSMTDYFDVRYYGGVHLVTDARVVMPHRVDEAAILAAAEQRPPAPVEGVEDFFHRHVIGNHGSVELDGPESLDRIELQVARIGDTERPTELGQTHRLAYRVVAGENLWFSGEYDWTPTERQQSSRPPNSYRPLIGGLARQARRLVRSEDPQVPLTERQANWLRCRAADLAANLDRWRA